MTIVVGRCTNCRARRKCVRLDISPFFRVVLCAPCSRRAWRLRPLLDILSGRSPPARFDACDRCGCVKRHDEGDLLCSDCMDLPAHERTDRCAQARQFGGGGGGGSR